ncbi:MAG: hypothetical protein ISS45_01420 [Candidatus Omnitrophica bacterium]|nr:hypothetical protein [Candidatus Omnitrophota bacterium]
MKRIFFFLGTLFYLFVLIFHCGDVFSDEKINPVRETPLAIEKFSNGVKLKLFYSPNCKHCVSIKEDYLPKIVSEYKDKIEIEYLNTAEKENFKLFLAVEKKFNVDAKVPSILIGNHFLMGATQIEANLEPILKEYIFGPPTPTIQIGKIDLLKKFHSFSPLAIIAAGLIDGVNPCAFTVLIFFISFLTLMGYKKKDLAVIGLAFILAVFLTYLAIGLGIFRGLYELKHFYTLLKVSYFGLAALCFIMAYLNLQDFFAYRKTKSPDSLKVKLPKPVRSRINAIIAKLYRKEANAPVKSRINLIVSTFIVGFLVSLLEAVCTGQVYLPTIVFILKEPTLRFKALFYLLLYNFMFVVPLLFILLLAILGTSSRKLEEFFKNKIALIKIFMFILFLGLGIFLLIGV